MVPVTALRRPASTLPSADDLNVAEMTVGCAMAGHSIPDDALNLVAQVRSGEISAADARASVIARFATA